MKSIIDRIITEEWVVEEHLLELAYYEGKRNNLK